MKRRPDAWLIIETRPAVEGEASGVQELIAEALTGKIEPNVWHEVNSPDGGSGPGTAPARRERPSV